MGWRAANAYDRENAEAIRQWQRDMGACRYLGYLAFRLRFVATGIFLASAVLWWTAGG